jgi:hypothetical protein
MVHDDLQDPGIAVTAQRLHARMFAAFLSLKKSLADGISDILMEMR